MTFIELLSHVPLLLKVPGKQRQTTRFCSMVHTDMTALQYSRLVMPHFLILQKERAMQYFWPGERSTAHPRLDEKASLLLSNGLMDGLLSMEGSQFDSANRSATPPTRSHHQSLLRITLIMQLLILRGISFEPLTRRTSRSKGMETMESFSSQTCLA